MPNYICIKQTVFNRLFVDVSEFWNCMCTRCTFHIHTNRTSYNSHHKNSLHDVNIEFILNRTLIGSLIVGCTVIEIHLNMHMDHFIMIERVECLRFCGFGGCFSLKILPFPIVDDGSSSCHDGDVGDRLLCVYLFFQDVNLFD